MPKENLYWFNPRKPTSAPLPEALKAEVTTRANELIETVLKPRDVQPPPENPQFNFIVDIYGKWVRKSFFFNAKYQIAYPDSPEPFFEAKFARMQYAGDQRFHLSFLRYTGQWVQVYTDLTVDECLEEVRDNPYFSMG